MPTMASITVKKADGTTDVTYTALNGAGGDGSPALWRSEAGANAALRPTLSMTTRNNGPKTARRVNLAYQYPEVVSISGVDTVVNRLPIELTCPIPMGMADAEIDQAVSQFANLVKATLIQASIKAGFAPN